MNYKSFTLLLAFFWGTFAFANPTHPINPNEIPTANGSMKCYTASTTVCPTGLVQLESQANVDSFVVNYPNCTSLFYLSIGPWSGAVSDISDISGLSNLTHITTQLVVSNNPQLPSLSGLDNIERTAGLYVFGNDLLTNLNGFGSLDTVDGIFYIKENQALTSISGVGNLKHISGDVDIESNHNLVSLSGFSSLHSVGGFELYNNKIASLSGLENLTTVNDYFVIFYEHYLQDLTGLD